MFSVTVQNPPIITVAGGRHEISYAVDGSLMNPLEAFYATLAGPRGPLTLGRFKTEVGFPETFTEEQKAKILDSISNCAVKAIVKSGSDIGFAVAEAGWVSRESL